MNMLNRRSCSSRTFFCFLFFTFVLCVAARNTNVYTTLSSTSDATCTDAVFRLGLFVNFVGRKGVWDGAGWNLRVSSFYPMGTLQSVPKTEQCSTLPGNEENSSREKKHK